MLEKEFVPYNEALELKELGFDESCFGDYRQWNENQPWLQLYQDLDGCSTDPADYEYTLEAKAPTFSQAFRWFREKHNLHISICHSVNGKFDCWTNNGNLLENGKYCDIDTYEEAELACLKKLIEIVKEK